VRKTALAVAALAVAVILQLTVLNGLRLPGGGVPDLVLVLVAALAMTDGPVRGMVTGFAAGLVLDLAPPGSAVLGEYALVFCLVGWAAGKLSRLATRSALQSLVMLAVVVVVGEALAAALSLALDPAQVTLAQVRQVLPYSLGYDLIITLFVLMLTLLASSLAARDRVDALEAAGALGAESAIRRPGRKWQPREPRLAPGTARPHDGWVGSRPPGLGGRPRPERRPAPPHGLRPANGVAGSALSGPARHPGLAARPVNLRLGSGRRGDGAIGNLAGPGLARHPGLHPGRRGTGPGSFRPHAGVPGGSAAGQFAALLRPTPLRPGGRRPVPVRFGARRGDATVGRLLGGHGPAGSGVRIPDGSGRGGLGMRFRRTTGPRFRQAHPAGPRSRRKAAPRFRRVPAAGPGIMAAGLRTGGADQAAILSARRRRVGTPRLRLGVGRRGDGVLGGSVLGTRQRRSVRPAAPRFRTRPLASRDTRGRKRPRFGYGRRSLLSFLAGRRIGGRWLASTRVGTRSGVWVLGKRTGGER
jgi:rod shape-determining protein MreD